MRPCFRLIMPLIGVTSLIALAILISTPPVLAQGGGYSETFDGELINWKYGDAWRVGNGQFLGRGAGEAIDVGQQWDDLIFSTSLRSMAGTLRISFRSGGGRRYFVELTYNQQDQIAARLVRHAPGADDVSLAESRVPYTPDQFRLQGLAVDITAEGGKFGVALGGKAALDAIDNDPLPAGWIGYETLDQSLAVIDELKVTPLQTASVDLVVQGVHVDRFERGSVIAVLGVDVANVGNAGSPGFELRVSDEQDGTNNSVTVGPLKAGEQRTITLPLEGPDSWQETVRRFRVELDPGGVVSDANRDNNTFVTNPINVPLLPAGGQPQPPSGQSRGPGSLLYGGLAVLIGGMIAVAAATGLALRQQLKIGQRQKWEKQAQRGQPPDRCTPPGYYVGVETQLDFKPMRITQLIVTATDPGRESVRRKQEVKGRVPNTLKLAILAHWLREPEQNYATRVAELSHGLSKTLTDFLQRETGRCDLAITVHVEGIELTATFTLYRCEKQGADGVWKKVESWGKKKTQERDDVIAQLGNRDPEATLPPGGFSTELEPLLAQYVKSYKIQG